MTITALAPRPCELREEDHSYWWLPTQERMAVSVTGVISHGKPPVDFSRYPEAAPRGTHVHRCMEAFLTGKTMPPPTSPEGIDCSDWINQFCRMKSWNSIDVLACEYTMTSARKSLGGQLDLLCRYKGKTLLVDLKTKGVSWKGPSKEDLSFYKAQAGGYLQLLQSGDGASRPPFVDECRTLVVTPSTSQWLRAMQPDDCSDAWENSWGLYSAHLNANPF